MKKIVLLFVTGMCMAFKSIAHGASYEITVDEYNRAISQLESVRAGKDGFQLSEDQLKEVDDALEELKRQRNSIPPGRTFKFPTPEETKQNILKLKRSAEWKKLSAIEKERIEEILRVIDQPQSKKHMIRDDSVEVQPVYESPQSLLRHKTSRKKEGTSGLVLYLSRPSTNRIIRIRFVPGK